MPNKQKIQKVPLQALCFDYGEPGVTTSFIGDGDKKTPQLNMIIYSGGVIKSHYYWDDLIIDLEGVSFTKKKYPILEDHCRDLKIAFIDGTPIIDKALMVDPEKTFFVSTPESLKFRQLSSEGFPYEASVRVKPMVIERIRDGAFGEANGIKIKGPGTIFRQWEFVEGSVCVFGYDRNTDSRAFSETIDLECQFVGDSFSKTYHVVNAPNREEHMDITTLKEQHPDLFKQIQDEAALASQKHAETQFTGQVNQLTIKMAELQTAFQKQEDAMKGLQAKNLALEKDNAIRTEAELSAESNRIWDTRLSKSGISVRLHEKVKKHVPYESFIEKESGKCDWTKFSETVDAEIKSWEENLAAKSTPSVIGGGGGQRSETGDEHFSDDEDTKWAEETAALVDPLLKK